MKTVARELFAPLQYNAQVYTPELQAGTSTDAQPTQLQQIGSGSEGDESGILLRESDEGFRAQG
jgi:hypothetical protein